MMYFHILIKRGMHISMSNDVIYENIYEAINFLEPGHPIINSKDSYGLATKLQLRRQKFYFKDGRYVLIKPEPWRRFYRGEAGNYKTCKPSLFRLEDEETKLLELLKTYHFISFINTQKDIKAFIKEGMFLDEWLLAQHYEFKTPILDLTNEIVVAAFFATHKFDPVTQKYNVAEDGLGAIRYTEETSYGFAQIIPAGLQPYARPNMQDGFDLILGRNHDFSNMSQKILFKQHKELNLKINDAIFGGVDYFPEEPISIMARSIKESSIITSDAVDRFLNDQELNNDGQLLDKKYTRNEIISFLKKKGINIADVDIIPDNIKSVYPWQTKTRVLIEKKAYLHNS